MDRLRRFLVALDRSDMDDYLIKAASVFADNHPDAQFYFFNVSPMLEIPVKVHEQYPDLIGPIDEAIGENIKADVKSQFNDLAAVHIDVREGNPTDQILKFASEKDIDLMILGQKPRNEGSGHHKDKIVNASSCSVMVIPKGLNYEHPKNLLVSLDFSETSKFAFERALVYAKICESRITAFHCYEVPTGYHTTGKSYEEFAAIMESNAEEHFNEFIESMDLGDIEVKNLNLLDRDGNTPKLIMRAAEQTNSDVIIVGSKGRTSFSKVLLGSVAAKLLRAEFDIPVMIIKSHGKNMGFLKALLEL